MESARDIWVCGIRWLKGLWLLCFRARGLEVFLHSEQSSEQPLRALLASDRLHAFEATAEDEGTSRMLQRIAETKSIGICGLRFSDESPLNQILQAARDPSVHVSFNRASVKLLSLHARLTGLFVRVYACV